MVDIRTSGRKHWGKWGSVARGLAVAGTALALLAGVAVGSSAGRLPRLLANVSCKGSTCSGVYRLRPRLVVLGDYEGGNLTMLSWRSWTATSASGSGLSVVSNMGMTTKSPITVTASRVRKGLFTRMTVTFTPAHGPVQVEKLKLAAGPASWQHERQQ
jgi:hypothetical protein